jgi:hypothetical protein
MQEKKAAVFVLLGQSNAVGHGIPMREEDEIAKPMKNVFGLSREQNQSFDITALTFEGYTSFGMNLAEEQDNTYSVANCLAAAWQEHIDRGNCRGLPDLYILQIAIGAQGVTEGYMWHPAYEKKLTPGKLGRVDISLFPFACHIFSMLDQSFAAMGKEYEIIGLHWRGGENDVTADMAYLEANLEPIYRLLLDGFNRLLHCPPTVLHRLVCLDRMQDLDPSGERLKKLQYINTVFDKLAEAYANVSVFDVREAPQYVPDVRGNGLFIKDVVHFTPEVNAWIAHGILQQYGTRR